MPVRIVLAAAIGSLLMLGRSAAQAPPAPADIQQKLKALDDKVERALKLLEGRAATPPDRKSLEKSLEIVTQAKEAVLNKFDEADKAYTDWRKRAPYAYTGTSAAEGLSPQLLKERATLQDLVHRKAELAARAKSVKDVGAIEYQARALLVLLQRRGVDLDQLRRTAGEDKVGPIELVRLYAESLSQESREVEQLIGAARNRLAEEERVIRDAILYEVQEERLRNARDSAKRVYQAIANQLDKIDMARGFSDKQKP